MNSTILLTCVFLLAFYGAVSGQEVYNKVGGKLRFPVHAKAGTFTNILWKLNKDKVAEYDGDFEEDATFYKDFKGRTSLDRATGVLVISGLQKRDEGVYTLQLDDNVVQTHTLSLIDAVPKPTINSFCGNKTTCSLTCEGNTTGAGPVTYSWRKKEAWETSGPMITVTTSDSNIDKYTCKLQNPISEAISEPFGDDLFGTGGSNTVAAVVGSLVVGGVLVGAALLGWKTGAVHRFCNAAGPSGTHSKDAEVGATTKEEDSKAVPEEVPMMAEGHGDARNGAVGNDGEQ